MNLMENTINYCEHHYREFDNGFAHEVRKGLSLEKKKLSCKYIYDDRGSELFQKIMSLPEYYLTGCEAEILQNNDLFFSSLFREEQFYLIELGAGDGKKTKILLNHFVNNSIECRYIPIDISSSAVERLIKDINISFPDLDTNGLVTEYFHGLKYLSGINGGARMVLFLGSNIGNMNPGQANEFLQKMHNSQDNGDYLLIGFDLKKDIAVLNKAYNDSQGISEKFNKNILERINKELGGTFETDRFEYCSKYEPEYGAIMTYLKSKEKQEIYIAAIDCCVPLEMGETIHTESSYKYDESDIKGMASENGFGIIKNLYDSRGFFIDSLWQVEK